MYFITYQPLKDKLRARSLSDHDALPYYIFITAITVFFGSIPLPNVFNRWDAVSIVLGIALSIGGILYVYHQNGGRNGYDIIQKCIVLGWVVSVRVVLCFIPVAIALHVIGMYLGFVTHGSTGWYDVVVMSSVYAVTYLRLGRHIKDTNGESSEQPLSPTLDKGKNVP